MFERVIAEHARRFLRHGVVSTGEETTKLVTSKLFISRRPKTNYFLTVKVPLYVRPQWCSDIPDSA